MQRKCQYCGKTYWSPYPTIWCSEKCHDAERKANKRKNKLKKT